MADDVDMANDRAEYERQKLIKKARMTPTNLPPPTGSCWNCEKKTYGRRWCCADCRNDWEKEHGKQNS